MNSNPEYDTVVSILRSAPYNWPTSVAPAREAVEEAAGKGMSAEAIAATADAYCHKAAEGVTLPASYPGGAYAWARHRQFAINKEMYLHDSRVALGLIVEVPVPHGPEARDFEAWLDNQKRGMSYQGIAFFDLSDPLSAKEWAGRLNAAKPENIPPNWLLNGLGDVYQAFVVEGLNTEWRGCGIMGSERKAFDDFRNYLGLSGQQVLDNLWAAHRLYDPRVKWLLGGVIVAGWED